MDYIHAIRGRMGTEAGHLGRRLAAAFAAAIENGEVPAGHALPGERQLAEMLDVSRSTLRQCLGALERRHLVMRRPGSGTEVVGQVRKALSRLSGFTEDMRAKGLEPTTRVIARSVMPAPPDIALRTGLPLGTPILRLTRLRLARGETFSFEHVNTPLSAVGADYDGTTSFYERLELRGLRPSRILQSLRAVSASADLAHQLGIAVGAALLEIRQIGYAKDGPAVEDTVGWYRGDKYHYVGEISG